MVAGSIVIDLLMKTGSFETDTKRAEKRLKALKDQATSAAMGIVAAGAAAATGLAYLVKGAIDEADELSKAATSLGLSTEALGAFRWAADLSGVSADELTSAFARLNKAAVAAAEGSKAQAETFARLGVSLTDTSGAMRDTESLMLDLFDAFAQLEEGPQKTALAMEIFGKSGAKLIPLLNAGRDGMAEMRAEAERLGLLIDGETAQATERFNDNLTRLTAAGKGLTNQIMIGAIPALEELSQELQNPETLAAAQSMAAGIVSAFNGIVVAIRETVNFAKWMGESFAAVTNGIAADDVVRLEQERERIQGLIGSWDLGSKTRLFGPGGVIEYWSDDELRQELTRIDAAIATYGERKPSAISLPPKPAAAGGRVLSLGGDEDSAIGGGGKRGGGGGGQSQQNHLLEEAQRIYESTRNSAERYAAEMARLNELQASGAIDQDTYNRAVANAKAAYESSRDALYAGLLTEEEELTKSYERRKEQILAATELTELERQDLLYRLQEDFQERMNELTGEGYWERWLESASEAMLSFNDIAGSALDEFSSSFGNAFEAIIFDSESLGDAFTNLAQNLARGVVNALGQMAAQWLAYQAVQLLVGKTTAASAATAQIFEAAAAQQMAAINAYASTAAIPIVGPAEAPAAAATALAATAPFVSAIAGLSSAAVGARADGGPVSMGMPYLIGERGPELFVPNTNGAVVPNNKIGGSPISINLIEDKRKAGTVKRNDENVNELDIFVADIMSDGPRSQAIQRAYGLQRQGY